jgi:hypothetical protein
MVSNNTLLNGAKVNQKVVHPSEVVQEHTPCFMFSEECPEGKVVKWDKELAELIEAGWVDHPGKVQKLPGHKKVWEKHQEAMKPKREPVIKKEAPMKTSKIDLSEKKTTK